MGRGERYGFGWLAACVMAAAGCASTPVAGPETGPGGRPPEELLEEYRSLDLVVGTPELPVVGRFAGVRGPEDSVWVGFAAALPPAALHFAREGDLFSASYQVRVLYLQGQDTVSRVDRREIVRVDDFRETARSDEAVVFQRFVLLPPGVYEAEVALRELTSRSEVVSRRTLRVPELGAGPSRLSVPLLVHRAAARRAYRHPPPLILAPRATAAYGREPARVLVESYGDAGELRLEAAVEGSTVWEETVRVEGSAEGPGSAIVPLPIDRLPPGVVRVRATAPTGHSTESVLLVALADEWAFVEFAAAVEHLRYALSADRAEAWTRAPPAERARLWAEFWQETDPDPKTPGNEFLGEYFRRMSEANRRFGDGRTEGWRTDRGQALVQLGEPDREIVHPARRTGERDQVEWVYSESLPIRVRLLFEDVTGFGTYALTQRSRFLLADAVEQLRRLRAGETGGRERFEDRRDVEPSPVDVRRP